MQPHEFRDRLEEVQARYEAMSAEGATFSIRTWCTAELAAEALDLEAERSGYVPRHQRAFVRAKRTATTNPAHEISIEGYGPQVTEIVKMLWGMKAGQLVRKRLILPQRPNEGPGIENILRLMHAAGVSDRTRMLAVVYLVHDSAMLEIGVLATKARSQIKAPAIIEDSPQAYWQKFCDQLTDDLAIVDFVRHLETAMFRVDPEGSRRQRQVLSALVGMSEHRITAGEKDAHGEFIIQVSEALAAGDTATAWFTTKKAVQTYPDWFATSALRIFIYPSIVQQWDNFRNARPTADQLKAALAADRQERIGAQHVSRSTKPSRTGAVRESARARRRVGTSTQPGASPRSARAGSPAAQPAAKPSSPVPARPTPAAKSIVDASSFNGAVLQSSTNPRRLQWFVRRENGDQVRWFRHNLDIVNGKLRLGSQKLQARASTVQGAVNSSRARGSAWRFIGITAIDFETSRSLVPSDVFKPDDLAKLEMPVTKSPSR